MVILKYHLLSFYLFCVLQLEYYTVFSKLCLGYNICEFHFQIVKGVLYMKDLF